MIQNINLIRAISSEFISRKLKSAALLIGIIALAVFAGAIWLTTINTWWWLVAVPVIMITLLEISTYLVVRTILKSLRPKLTKQQASDVANFVDKFERVADNLQTPKYILIFRMVRDIVRPHRKNSFVRSVAADSSTLHKDFLELKRNFS